MLRQFSIQLIEIYSFSEGRKEEKREEEEKIRVEMFAFCKFNNIFFLSLFGLLVLFTTTEQPIVSVDVCAVGRNNISNTPCETSKRIALPIISEIAAQWERPKQTNKKNLISFSDGLMLLEAKHVKILCTKYEVDKCPKNVNTKIF